MAGNYGAIVVFDAEMSYTLEEVCVVCMYPPPHMTCILLLI
jgi:hypothetical protein